MRWRSDRSCPFGDENQFNRLFSTFRSKGEGAGCRRYKKRGLPTRFFPIMKPNRSGDRVDEIDPAFHPDLRPSPSAETFWNKSESLARLGGDEALLRELCEIFLDECPKLLQKLRQAIAADDPEAVMRAAHSLKGELGYLGATAAAQASRELEDMGHEKNISRANEVCGLLERELGDVCLAIQDFIGVVR